MTLRPQELGAEHARKALDAGATREALVQAASVAYLFTVYTRLADTLGWQVPSGAVVRRMADVLLRFGY